jgi:hypothetical protein
LWVNTTHIAKIAAKSKNGSKHKYFAERMTGVSKSWNYKEGKYYTDTIHFRWVQMNIRLEKVHVNKQ